MNPPQAQRSLPRQLKIQNGFVLLPVVMAITLVAAIAFLMNREGAMAVNQLGGEVQSSQARLAAKAGMEHTLWQVNKSNCTGYSTLSAVNFGTGSYSATVTPTDGSPVSISATGTHANGASSTINRDRVKVYLPPTTVTLQLGNDPGMDTYISSTFSTINYGIGDNSVFKELLLGWRYRNQLIQFDLSTIPTTVDILSAQLQLYQKSGMGTANVTVHRLKQSWVEGTKNGSGTADGATWQTSNGTLPWTTSGGDYDAIAIGSGTSVTDGSGITDSWEIAPLVQDWLTGKYPNNGMLLKTEGNISHTFASKQDTTAAQRPKLAITYACECGTPCSCTPGNFRDQYASIAYTGNNGSFTWTNNWQETGETDGPTTGKLRVISDTQCASSNCMKLRNDTSTVMRLTREANLATAVSASLNFSYRRGVTGTLGGAITLEISKNGGSTFTLLKTYQLNAADTSPVNESIDISPYLAANTQIRFSTNGSNFQTNIFIDNVNIITSCVPAPTLVTLNPVADAFIDNQDASDNYGASTSLIITFVAANDQKRIVLRFDTSGIPNGALIQSAKLRLNVANVSSASNNPKAVSAYALTQSWVEGSNTGSGTANGVTWNKRDSSVAWTTVGGTYRTPSVAMAVEETSGISPPPGSFRTGWLYWDLTALTQEWVDGVSVNNGLLLISTVQDEQRIDSKEKGGSTIPQLVLTYTAP